MKHIVMSGVIVGVLLSLPVLLVADPLAQLMVTVGVDFVPMSAGVAEQEAAAWLTSTYPSESWVAAVDVVFSTLLLTLQTPNESTLSAAIGSMASNVAQVFPSLANTAFNATLRYKPALVPLDLIHSHSKTSFMALEVLAGVCSCLLIVLIARLVAFRFSSASVYSQLLRHKRKRPIASL